MAKAKRGKTLVIVESPAKAKTINKYLGDKYVVKASMGHVRDLPKDGLGIDLENRFEPTYEVVVSRSKTIKELQKLAKTAPEVVLATDRDREGEAIAWHLVEALGLDPANSRRVIFNEITKTAINEAFAHPYELDMDRVYAQQARRVLDRIVGYQLSPLLWQKIAKGLSAGRVQSVAVRLIVERENEIRAFVPEESWKVQAYFSGQPDAATSLRPAWDKLNADEPTQKAIQEWLSGNGSFKTELSEIGGQPFKPDHYEAARAAVEALGYNIDEVKGTTTLDPAFASRCTRRCSASGSSRAVCRSSRAALASRSFRRLIADFSLARASASACFAWSTASRSSGGMTAARTWSRASSASSSAPARPASRK